MIEEFAIHNQFWESLSRFAKHDPHLKKINGLPLIYHSPFLDQSSFHTPGIYLITGGRQVGKTTFLKQFILKLLKNHNVPPESILFLTGELIDTHHMLRRTVEQFYNSETAKQYLFIDEVNYIPDWDKSIKYLADSGIFERMSVLLTGSDSLILRTAMKRFPGRRGMSEKVDFNFHPLSFNEFICLKDRKLAPVCAEIIEKPLATEISHYDRKHDRLNELFLEYLLHGGYLPAITDYQLNKTVSKGVMNIYIQWIIGDILKHNKSENYLFEVLKGIKATYNSQISWNNLAKYLSIEHHKTVSDYCCLLESIHVLYIQQALLEHKLTGAPKKNRKIYFQDPFIDHATSIYLNLNGSFDEIAKRMSENEFASSYVEGVVVDHCKRFAPTYYIKGAKGEVDVAIIQDERFYPIEVKWVDRVRPETLKQINCYKDGLILTKRFEHKMFGNNRAIPLVKFLIHISSGALNVY